MKGWGVTEMDVTKKLGIRDALRIIKSIGAKTIYNTIRYARFRDRQDHNYLRATEAKPVSPSDIVSTTRLPNGERFRFVCGPGRIELEIIFLTQDLVQVSWGNARQPVPYAIERTDWLMVDLEHEVSEGEYRLKSSSLQITILPDGGIRFINNSGRILREEMPPEFRENKSTHRALLEPDSAIYGLGERASTLNLRGGSYTMWNSEVGGIYAPGQDPLYTCIPVYMVVSPHLSYLIFYENPARSRFTFTETAEIIFEAGMLRYYFINGAPDQLLERFTDLTGKPALPPRWALGYHQSRWGYKTEGDIRRIAQEFKQHQMPISAIHIDIDYMQGFRVFTVNPDRFPDLKHLSEELDSKQVKLVTILDPGIKEDKNYFMYQEGIKGKYFCLDRQGKPLIGVVWPGRSLFPDFTNPAVREWWSEKYSLLLYSGISGFWHDMNEPSSFSAWGDHSLPLSTQHNFDGQGGDHLQGHNLYGLLMTRAGYEAFRRYCPDKRPWFLTRAAWAGFQRYAWNWTGDIETSWRILRTSIATVLGLSLSGQPYSGPDIGGFSGDPTPELYTRWIQLSAFLPFFRTHSSMTGLPREPWTFGEPYTTIIRYFLEFRYRLLPYWYSLAWQASQTGRPLVKPLFWLNPADPNLYNADDMFLLGDAILVAPVLEAGATERTIDLPPGQWHNFWDDTVYQASDKIVVSAPLDKMPIFIKAGKILPLYEEDTLTLHLYISNSSLLDQEDVLTLYTDAGDGWPVKPEDYRIDKFNLHIEDNTLYIRRKTTGEYPWPYGKTRLQIHGVNPSQVLMDRAVIPFQDKDINTGLFQEISIKLL